MPTRYHDEIELLNAEDVERIYRRTDDLELHRDWVVVPLACAREGREIVLPDGRVLLRPPGLDAFEPWLQELHTRLAELDLARTARRSVDDPSRHLTGTNGPRLCGTRGYLKVQPDLNGSGDASVQPLAKESIASPQGPAEGERREAEMASAGVDRPGKG